MLCIARQTTLQAVENIKSLRANKLSIEDIIFVRLINRENYKVALKYFLESKEITEDIISAVGFNIKSRTYDKVYYILSKKNLRLKFSGE